MNINTYLMSWGPWELVESEHSASSDFLTNLQLEQHPLQATPFARHLFQLYIHESLCAALHQWRNAFKRTAIHDLCTANNVLTSHQARAICCYVSNFKTIA